MGEVFLKLLNMSLTASFLIVVVILLRLVLKKAPKWTRGILWRWWRCGCFARFLWKAS